MKDRQINTVLYFLIKLSIQSNSVKYVCTAGLISLDFAS